MEEVILEAQARATGKTAVKELRKRALIPAVYYTEQRQVHHIVVDAHAFSRMVSRETPLIHLRLDGEELPCIIREIQRHAVSGRVIHVDFYGVERSHKLRVTVPLRLIGTPAGVQHGGILEHAFREIEIECLPHHLPPHLEVDVSHLDIGDSVRIENLSFENVTLLNDPHTIVAQVVHPRLEQPTVKAEEPEGEVKEPEVIKARRTEEGESKSKEK